MATYRYHLDTRDGTVYPCVLMPDGKWWSSVNLNWSGSGMNLGGTMMYRFSDIAAATPPGAHIPSKAEWDGMLSAVGGNTCTKLRTSDWINGGGVFVQGTDDYWFSATASGWDISGQGTYVLKGYVTGFRVSGTNLFKVFDPSSSPNVWEEVDNSDGRFPIRFIVDTFVEPHYVKLFGADFDGFERGMTVTIKRPIDVEDSHGGGARLIPWGPATLDEWHVDAELLTSAARAQVLESVVPPYGVPSDTSWRLPPRHGVASFPGLLPASAGDYADQYLYPQMTSFESQGRKGPVIDLFGYRVQAILRTYGSGATTNPSTAPTTTAPTWLQQKFAAHQIQDWSSLQPVVASAAQGVGTSFGRVKHGRRRDVNFNLDHLTADMADQLVAWFRGVRHNTTTVLMDRGPEGIVSTAVYLVGLQLHRTALHWDGTLETVLA